jgi:hypothetical protein
MLRVAACLRRGHRDQRAHGEPSGVDAFTERLGAKAGQSNEFTLIAPLNTGGAERLRKLLAKGFIGMRKKNIDRIGTVHDLRLVLFDNDTRLIFASTYDGDWDSYMDDFATIIPDELDLLFHECTDYPGARSTVFKDWLVKNQVEALAFYSGYPDASVRHLWKALNAMRALDDLLDIALR